MFSRRRPIPTARTIKLLYQLGYIASGTAAGLATLCLEEQRRRIKVLQKIADNAKIIRQHPRHRGNLAAAVAEVEAEENSQMDGTYAPFVEDIPRVRHRRRRKSRDSAENNSPDGTKLISAAEREHYRPYGHELAEGHTHADEQGPQRAGSSAQERWRASHRDTVLQSSFDGYHSHSRDTSSRTRYPVGALLSGSPRVENTTSRRHISTHSKSEELRENHTFFDFIRNLSSQNNVAPAPDSIQPPRQGIESVHVPLTRDFSIPDSKTSINVFDMPLEDWSEEMDTLSNALRTGAYRSNKALESISTYLLRSALETGSADDIRSLCRWKMANGSFSQTEAQELCRACGKLGRRLPYNAIYDLFNLFFESESFFAFDKSFRLEQLMIVSRQMLAWRAPPQPKELRSKVFGSGLQYLSDDAVTQELERHCYSLLAMGEISVAVGLARTFADASKRTAAITASFDKSFDEAIEKSRPKDCIPILRWKVESLGSDSIQMQLKPFVHACGYANEHSTLIEFFNSKTGLGLPDSLLSKHLGVGSKVILAKAFGTDELHGDDFRRLCKSLPRSLRSSLESLREIPALGEMWKTTRNLKQIDARASELKAQLHGEEHQRTLQQLEETILEIYVDAGEIDRALAVVSRLNNTYGMSNATLCQTALAFAKMDEWIGLDRLLNLLKKSDSFRFNGDAARMFDKVIWRYSRHHEPKEVWNFVDGAMRDLGFVPSRTTTELILLSFVRRGRFELIPQWIAFIQQNGTQVWIDTEMAAVLLERYCVQYRPSHILVMWLCRKLVSLSPSLAGESLLDLVKQSIGYDLRHLDGQYEDSQQHQAEKRLSRVQEAKKLVPSPGFVWNGRLFFHEAEAEKDLDPEPTDNAIDRDDAKDVQRNIWLNISIGQYQEAIDLYRTALDSRGLPPSPKILEAAVEASLRLHNGVPAHANAMIGEARKAGMNTSCAEIPLFIHRIRQLPPRNLDDVQRLRWFVLEQYRKAERNRWSISHALATTAANCLIKHGFAEQGVGLLRFIHASRWAEKIPFDHVAMAVMLKGYIISRQAEGVRWVVETALDENIRITEPFIEHLKYGKKTMPGGKHVLEDQDQVNAWIQQCNERRLQQMAETRAMGWKLVKSLAKATKEGSTVDMDFVDDVEEYSIAGDGTKSSNKAKADFNDESYFSDEVEHDASIRDEQYSDFKRRVEKDWKAEQQFRRQMKSVRWSHKDALEAENFDTPAKFSDNERNANGEEVEGSALERDSLQFVPFT